MINYRRLKDATWEVETGEDSWIPATNFNRFLNTSSVVVLAWNNRNMAPRPNVSAMVEMHESGCEHLLEDGRRAYDFMGWNELYPNFNKALDGLYEYSQELLKSEDGDGFQFSEDGVMIGSIHSAPCMDKSTMTDEEAESNYNRFYDAWLAQHPELEDDRNMTDEEYEAYLARNPVYARYVELSEKIDKMLDEDDYAELPSGEKEEFEELSAIYQYKIDERFG